MAATTVGKKSTQKKFFFPTLQLPPVVLKKYFYSTSLSLSLEMTMTTEDLPIDQDWVTADNRSLYTITCRVSHSR